MRRLSRLILAFVCLALLAPPADAGCGLFSRLKARKATPVACQAPAYAVAPVPVAATPVYTYSVLYRPVGSACASGVCPR